MKKKKPSNPSAGLGDPYWYEWSVGLEYVLDLLDLQKQVSTVTLQKSGYKGLDDVVVTFATGKSRFIQVKHTRAAEPLTFGDLVTSGENEDSLLKHMATGWLAAGKPAEVWLLTNRQAGTQKYTPKAAGSITRPPLRDFITSMHAEAKVAATLSTMTMKPEWKDAWDNLWLPELDDLKSDATKLAFLQAMEVRHSEPELSDLRTRLLERIAILFAIEPAASVGFLTRLDSALRVWATSVRGKAESITKEAAYEALCLEEDSILGDHDFPPPAPFFPSRLPAVDAVVELLQKRNAPVVFVTGEPGSGKTALLSHLANRRDPVIDARFHAYRPITPESQLLPLDSEVTKTRTLWSDLLIKLRALARGRLFELRVPVHAGSLSVEDLRAHVLRIANSLGEAEQRPFVIAIDGIDHAARAGEDRDTFLASLVPPDQVPDHVTFLIGGQPSDAYLRQYPAWLRPGAQGVETYQLPRLGLDDARALVDARLDISSALADTVARDVHDATDGHTLSTVFAVEEARLLGDNLGGLPSRLANRALPSGIEGYYKAIWLAATRPFLGASSLRLAACLTLVQSRTTPEMVRAVVNLDGTIPVNWTDVLRTLRPLVVEEARGFRVFHNDFRVFLHGLLRKDHETYKESASLLGDFLRDGDDPLARHASVQSLYVIAERPRDQASVFDPHWVLEGHAVGRRLDMLSEQAVTAVEALALLDPDWSLAHQVAGGLKTLQQLQASLQWRDGVEGVDSAQTAVISPRGVERAVPAKLDWTHGRVLAAIGDVRELCDLGETERACAAFGRWFGGLSPKEVADSVQVEAGAHEHQQQDATRTLLAALGSASAVTTILLACSAGTGGESAEAAYAHGLLGSADGFATRDRDFAAVLLRVQRLYWSDIEKLLWRLVDAREWRRCGFVLQTMGRWGGKPWYFRLSGAVAAAILGDSKLQMRWTEPVLADRSSAISAAVEHSATGLDEPSQITVLARLAVLFGIAEPKRDASGLRQELETAYQARESRDERHDAGVTELLHAAALLGSLVRTTRDGTPHAIHCDPTTVARTVIALATAVERHPYRIPSGYPPIASWIVKGILECASGDGELKKAICAPLLERISQRKSLGQLLAPVWRFLSRAAYRQELRSYAEAWIGSDGIAWTLAPAERHELISEFANLLTEIGETEAAKPALLRLPWTNIGYTGHKDYSLSQALEWFRELAEVNTCAWEEQGLRLLTVSREASRTGDNRVGASIKTAVLSAACLYGPPALARIVLADETTLDVGDEALVYALLRMLETKTLERSELLSIWAFCIGQQCWRVHADRQVLADARDALLAAAQRRSIRDFGSDLRSMGAAEFACQQDPVTTSPPLERDTPDYSSLSPTAAIRLAAIHKDWEQLVASLDEARAEGGATYTACVDEAWTTLERREEQVWWFDGVNEVYERLFPLATPSQRWDAVRRLVLADHFLSLETRILTIQSNLDAMCLLVASQAGLTELRGGVDRLLAMHTLWIEGGGRLPPLTPIPVDAASTLTTWQEVLLAILLKLLEFDEQTYAQATLRGIFALLTANPTLLNHFVEFVSYAPSPVASRLLLIAEPIVAEGHGASITECLARLMAESPRLDTALSAWSALLLVASKTNGVDPSWPHPTEAPPLVVASSTPLISGFPSHMGLHTTATRSSHSFLAFMRVACDDDLEDVESVFASSIRDDPPSRSRSRRRTRENGDYVLNLGDEAESDRLFEVLRKHDRQGRFSDVDIARLAQALVPAADPFVFLRTPPPHHQADEWPIDTTLEERLAQSPELLIHELVGFLRSDLPADQRVLGGSVTSHSRKWDVKVVMHHRLPPPSGGVSEPPRVLNGRTSLLLRDFGMIFGPGSGEGWLTWGVSGLFLFIDGVVDTFPSPLWRRLGWSPSASDPTQWLRGKTVAAWHERRLGPMRQVYGHDLIYRHPTLTRWVCTANEWDRLRGELGEPESRLFPERARVRR